MLISTPFSRFYSSSIYTLKFRWEINASSGRTWRRSEGRSPCDQIGDLSTPSKLTSSWPLSETQTLDGPIPATNHNRPTGISLAADVSEEAPAIATVNYAMTSEECSRSEKAVRVPSIRTASAPWQTSDSVQAYEVCAGSNAGLAAADVWAPTIVFLVRAAACQLKDAPAVDEGALSLRSATRHVTHPYVLSVLV